MSKIVAAIFADRAKAYEEIWPSSILPRKASKSTRPLAVGGTVQRKL